MPLAEARRRVAKASQQAYNILGEALEAVSHEVKVSAALYDKTGEFWPGCAVWKMAPMACIKSPRARELPAIEVVSMCS